ncbi:hypothetical protein T492DRAFT_961289, partial [Pavlovales sp. CCMP2436]
MATPPKIARQLPPRGPPLLLPAASAMARALLFALLLAPAAAFTPRLPSARPSLLPRNAMRTSAGVGSERAGSERAGSERAGSERAGSERAGSDEVAPSAELVQTARDGGAAKTDAMAALGAQLQAQSNDRARQARSSAFTGALELHVRAGCPKGATVRSALLGLRVAAAQLIELDVDSSDAEDASAEMRGRAELARASGVPQLYVLREGEPAELIANLWMEIGSGAFQRRLSS